MFLGDTYNNIFEANCKNNTFIRGCHNSHIEWSSTDNVFQERLDRLGITPTGVGSGRNREYLIRNCGHSVILRTDEISRGTLICSICDELSFKKNNFGCSFF